MAIIEIENMEFYSYHGCFAEESKIGTHFLVSLWLDVDTTKAQRSDNIEDTVNYLSVYQTVKKQMAIPSHLLEHVADRIASSVMDEFHAISNIRVKIVKRNPPLGGRIEGVALTIEKTRE